MNETTGLLAIISMIVSIISGIPTAIRGWRDIIWQRRREDAIRDDCNMYVTSDEDDQPSKEFSPTSGQKDYTRYSLDGLGEYGKGRLVLAVIKKYVAKNSNITYNDLTRVFPKQLRGVKNKKSYWGCVSLKRDAVSLFQETGMRRHFLDAKDILTLADGTEVAVSSQWGIGNIDAFIKNAVDLGFRIEKISQ